MTDVKAEKVRKRVRAHRDRRRHGIRCIPIRLTDFEVAELVKRLYLEPEAIKNGRSIGIAAETALSDLFAK